MLILRSPKLQCRGDSWLPPPPPMAQLLLQLPGILGGPAEVALLVVAITHGKTGLKEWIRPLFRWKVGLQ